MTDRFKNAVDALVYAFFNDTLAKGDCACCAVGNWVAWCDGIRLTSTNGARLSYGVMNYYWKDLFVTRFGSQNILPYGEENVSPGTKESVLNTGYSIEEVAKVEYAFETSTKIFILNYQEHTKSEIMQDQYNGLMAVLDVLCEIEGIEDPSEYKELFAMS